MQKITTFLWFDDDAEEAIDFYTSVFGQSRIVRRSRDPDGKLISATFELEGQRFMALNGGPGFEFTAAISLFVDCEDQEEVDTLWERLCEGGAPGRCGWLKDRYGLSWQIIPSALGRMLGDEDPEKAQRVMAAMLEMDKIDVAGLERAYAGA